MVVKEEAEVQHGRCMIRAKVKVKAAIQKCLLKQFVVESVKAEYGRPLRHSHHSTPTIETAYCERAYGTCP